MRAVFPRCLVIVPLLVAGGWTLSTPRDPGSHVRLQLIERTGTIDSWSVGSDGTVAVRLSGRHEGEEFAMWFTTPGDKTDTTRFEHLVLAIVLTAVDEAAGEFLVTAESDTGNEVKGQTLEDALPLDRISHYARGARPERKPR